MRRKSDAQIKDELRSIYASHDGTIPDMTKLERRSSSKVTRFLVRAILFLLVLSAVAWAGFFLWSRGGIAPQRPLETETDVPETVKAGQEAFYTFRYDNAGNAPIAALEMKLTLPPEFVPTSFNPEPTDGLMWTLGSLSRGSDGAVTVGGVFRSEVPSTQTIQALYTYRPANFSSDFQDISTARVEVDESVLNLTLTGPEEALPGDEVTYVVNVQNGGTRDVENALVTAALPDGFAITTSDPASVEPGAAAWSFENLTPGELKAVTFKGRFTASVSGAQTLKAAVSLLNADRVEFLQAQSEAATEVVGGAIAFHLVANGSAGDQTADPGSTLRLSIDYANNGNETIRGLAFSLAIKGDAATLPIDWANTNLDGGTRSGSTITWNEDAYPAFEEFSPSTSGVIDLTLPLTSTLTSAMASTLTLSLTASVAQIGSIASPRTVEASPITILVNSDFRSSAHARYYSDDAEPLGTGPLPPKVGQTTTFRVFWRVANSFHALENVRMTTNLPPGVSWTGNAHADVGTISFDATTRIVSWTIPALPVTVPGSETTFDVAIVPESDDVGSFYKLTNAIAVEATDAFTRDQVQDGIDILTTELPEDELAAGKGVVVD